MLSWLKRKIRLVPARTAPKKRGVRAGYDAVNPGADVRHWANADALSADSANSLHVRKEFRQRGRYEVANNSYAKGIARTMASYVIGTGPRLQINTDSDESNQLIEREFKRWSRKVKLSTKLRLMHKSRTESGECFLVFRTDPKLKSRIKLNFDLIEADQVTTPDLSLLDENRIDGIELDEHGQPEYYHILRQHPGDMSQFHNNEYDPVPADEVIHYFLQERPGQHRGIPTIAPSLSLFGKLRRYVLAVLEAAENAANMAMAVHTDAPADDDDEEVPESMEEIEIARNMATFLPAGYKITQLRPEQPTTTFAEFKKEIINEIARCLSMPFNVAACNSSDYNYASGRMDHQVFYKEISVEREDIALDVLDRIFEAWLSEAVLVENYLPQNAREIDVDLDPEWLWDGYEHVDPVKEATAQSIRLDSNTTTLQDEWARQGHDYARKLLQRGSEVAIERELEIDTASRMAIDDESSDGRDD